MEENVVKNDKLSVGFESWERGFSNTVAADRYYSTHQLVSPFINIKYKNNQYWSWAST